jgi:hypothetical protein
LANVLTIVLAAEAVKMKMAISSSHNAKILNPFGEYSNVLQFSALEARGQHSQQK